MQLFVRNNLIRRGAEWNFAITSKTKAKAQKRRIKNESKWVTLRINSVQDQRCQNLRGKMTMNIRELKKALKAAGIPAESYNLDGKGRDDERLCLVNENSKWVVYYLERGVRTTELFFDREDEACDYILKSFR